MAKTAAIDMTDASEVARLMAPLIEERLSMPVDAQISRDILHIVGETVAKMIDSGVIFAQPFAPFVVETVALQVGKSLMGMAVSSVQDSIAYAALAGSLGVNLGMSFAILPSGGVGAVGAANMALAGGRGAVEAEPFSVDLSVTDAIDALLTDVLAAKKPVEDIETLEFLIAKSVEKGNVEAEIFLLEQLVVKLEGGRGAITKLRRLVELTMGGDVKRAIGYLQQIRAIYAGKEAKNAAKNIEGVDGEIAALEKDLAEAKVEVVGAASGEREDEEEMTIDEPVVRENVVVDDGDREDVPRDVVISGGVPGNGDLAAGEAVAVVSPLVVEEPDAQRDSRIVSALKNVQKLAFDGLRAVIAAAIVENDGEAIEAFRTELLKRGGVSNTVASLVAAHLAVVDILTRAGLCPEAVEHQRRALALRTMFNRHASFEGQFPAGELAVKLEQLIRDADKNSKRVVPEPVQVEGAQGGGAESGGRRRRRRSRDRHRGAERRHGQSVAQERVPRREEDALGSGDSDGRSEKKRPDREYLKNFDAMGAAYRADDKEAWLKHQAFLLDSHFSRDTIALHRKANMWAAKFFERAEDFPNALKHFEKVLALQRDDLRDTQNPSGQSFIAKTEENIDRVKALCPQIF